MAPRLTLFRWNGACSIVPHAIFLHFNIPVKIIPMELGPEGIQSVDGTISHAEYIKIHPLGYVPVLGVDDEYITELPAILNYVSSLIPEEKLFSDEGLGRARVAEWLNYLSGAVHGSGFGMLFRPSRYSDNPTHFESIQKKGRETIRKHFGIIDARLKGKEFAVGESLTAADFYLYIFSRWGKEHGIGMEDFPNYSDFARRLEGVEGIKKAVKAEGLEFRYSS